MAVKKATAAKKKAPPARKVAAAKKETTPARKAAPAARANTSTRKAPLEKKTVTNKVAAAKSAAKTTTKTKAAKTTATAPTKATTAKRTTRAASKVGAASKATASKASAAKATRTAAKATGVAARATGAAARATGVAAIATGAAAAATGAAAKATGAAAKATGVAAKGSVAKTTEPVVPLQARPSNGASARPQRLPVRNSEKPWRVKELTAVRTELETDIARLRNEISRAELDLAGLMRDAGDGAGDDQADAGTKTFEREQEISLANNAREMFDQSGRALARIIDGSYGVCESCENPIGKNRLLAFPRATLCMTCKSKQERR